MYSKSVQDRMSLIGQYVSTGDVLDLGCVDARPSREDSKSRLDRKPGGQWDPPVLPHTTAPMRTITAERHECRFLGRGRHLCGPNATSETGCS